MTGLSKEGVFGQGEVDFSAVATHLGDVPRERGVRAIDG